jgi:hypothetical protein
MPSSIDLPLSVNLAPEFPNATITLGRAKNTDIQNQLEKIP